MTWNKYGARKAAVPEIGIVCDSLAEAERARELWRISRSEGRLRITDLEWHPEYVLSKKPSVKVTFDSRYREDGVLTVEDVKGAIARDFRVRLAWFVSLYPDVRVKVVKRRGPGVFEEVVMRGFPKGKAA